jgi:hypothetical protein
MINKKLSPARIAILLIFALLMLLMLNAPAATTVIAQEPTPTPAPDEDDDVDGQIVGGAPADPGEWPWQVALINGSATEFYYSQFCGGSLISSQWVLTAAHCVVNSNGAPVAPSSVDIVAGIYNLSSPAAGYQRRDISQIIIHPDFNKTTLNNDVALLRLASPVTLGGSGAAATAAIPLVSASLGDLAGTDSWTTGWGYTESSPAFPSQLYEVTVPIVTNTQCNTSYGGAITPSMLCAGLPEGGKDTCQGDSGGPLAVYLNGQWQLAGVVSWGNGCADPGFYGVYARVSSFIPWIQANATVFADVPASHWAREYIEAMYLNGYTAGCSVSGPLLFCPEMIMNRAQSAVFLLRGEFGVNYVYPPPPYPTFQDNFSSGPWAQPWAQGLYNAGMTAGCSLSGPLLFCPWDNTTRAQLAVFGLRMKFGDSYPLPPATGTVFADMPAGHWATGWAEQAYANGLIPACGTQGGKPMFCPDSLVTRASASYTIVKAKGLLP